jgi:CubicO group peptidase (beta-lactamase class C family)
MFLRIAAAVAILIAYGHIAAIAAPAPPATTGGTIKTVSSNGQQITVTVGSGNAAKDQVFSVAAGTKVTLDGKAAEVGELVPGMKVTVTYDKDSKQAASIRASKPNAATTGGDKTKAVPGKRAAGKDGGGRTAQTKPRAGGDGSQAAAAKGQGGVQADFRRVLELACRQSNLPALGAAVVVDGKVVAAGAVGVRKLGTQTPVAADDAFHIGSCAKAMTATVIGVLVDNGRLRWDMTLAEAFPAQKGTIHSAYRAVTVEQILAHRGGFPPNPPGMTPPDIHNLPGRTLREKRLAFVDRVLREAPATQPGQQFEYSNVGYTVAGAIAEQATNKQWESLQQEWLFKPLGMRGVHFGEAAAGAQNARPWGHLSLGGQVTPFPPGPNPNDPPAMSPAGSVVHCAMADLARFAAVHLGARDGEKPLLKSETLKRLHTPLVAVDSYAAGWGLTQWEGGSGTVLTHAGATPMNYCAIWLDLDRKFAVMVATNIGPDRAANPCSDVCGKLMELFLK